MSVLPRMVHLQPRGARQRECEASSATALSLDAAALSLDVYLSLQIECLSSTRRPSKPVEIRSSLSNDGEIVLGAA